MLLTRDREFFVRSAAIANPSLPAEQVEALVREGITNKDVLPELMHSPILTAEQLTRLQAAGVPVTAAMFRHPACPPDLLRIAIASTGSMVRRCAAAHPNLPPDLWDVVLTDQDARIRAAAASNPAIPEARLQSLANDRNLTVVKAVVKRAQGAVKDEAASHLARRSKAVGSRYLLAAQARDEQILDRLAMDESRWMRRRVMRNPFASETAKVSAALLGS